MPPTAQILPSGSYNNVGTSYLSPLTVNGNIDFCREPAASTVLFRLNGTSQSLDVDTINELTAAAGVTLDSVLLKDGGVRLANNVTLKARNQANSADVDILKLNTSNELELSGTYARFGSDLRIAASTSDASDNAALRLAGGGGTFSNQQLRGAYLELFGNEHASSAGKLNLFCGTTGSLTLGSVGSQDINIVTNNTNRIVINGNGAVQILNQTTAGTAGAISEYWPITFNGSARKIPMYAA